MKFTLTILVIFAYFSATAQNCYSATYDGIYTFAGQTFEIHLDSGSRKAIENVDTNWQENIINEHSNNITWKVVVSHNDSITYVVSKDFQYPSFVSIKSRGVKLKRVSNKYFLYIDSIHSYKPMNEEQGLIYHLTGNTKIILNYVCHEAICKHKNEKRTVWLCNELPSAISPGILCNLSGAIMEWYDEENHFIIRSIEKCK